MYFDYTAFRHFLYYEDTMSGLQISLVIMCACLLLAFVCTKAAFKKFHSKPIPSATCDIITPLNTYVNVKCNTVIFYNNDHIEFTYDNGQTITVSTRGTDIKFNNGV